MSNELNIFVESSRKEILSQVSEILRALPKVTFRLSEGLLPEDSAQAGKSSPDIIILDEDSGDGDIVTRLLKLQEQFGQSAFFVISHDTSPKNIVRLMKAGASEFIGNPLKADNLIDAVEEFRIKRMNSGKVSMGKICSFISSKGGLGSSVLAVNSAAALAR